ncbi:MAG: hypothetical protein WBZ36_17990 [Candidatus Nitrosopolaris sp.]
MIGMQNVINKTMLVKHLSTDVLNNPVLYMCGPPIMLNAIRKLSKIDLSIPKERIKIEEFTGY